MGLIIIPLFLSCVDDEICLEKSGVNISPEVFTLVLWFYLWYDIMMNKVYHFVYFSFQLKLSCWISYTSLKWYLILVVASISFEFIVSHFSCFPCLDWPALNSLLHSSMMLTDLVLDLPCHTTLLCSSELNLCPSFFPSNLTCESLFLWMKRRIRKSRLWYNVWRLHMNSLSFNASLCVCVCV